MGAAAVTVMADVGVYSDAISGLAYSLGGFVVGFMGARWWYVDVRSREHLMDTGVERRSGDDRRHGDRRATASAPNLIVGIVLVLIAVLSVAASTVAITQQQAQVDCQTRYNEAFAAALTERTNAAGEVREAFRAVTDAMRRVIATVAILQNRPPSQENEAQFIGALDNYLKVTAEYDRQLAKSEQQREQNPLPPPPTEVCG